MTDHTTPESTPPATDPAGLRNLVAAAIYERNNPAYRWADAHPDDVLAYGFDADAVLSVLPAPADRAAVLTETQRRMLDYALDQADDEIARDGSAFTDEEEDAVAELRRLTTLPAPADRAAVQPVCELPHATVEEENACDRRTTARAAVLDEAADIARRIADGNAEDGRRDRAVGAYDVEAVLRAAAREARAAQPAGGES
jgi:hypothetical protein